MTLRLHVRLQEAKKLPNMDVFSKSDPYCYLYTNSGQRFKSSVRKNTNNPRWNEDFHFEIYNASQDKLHVDLYDEDVVFDDPMSYVQISLNTLQVGQIADLWYDLIPRKNARRGGQLRLLLHLAPPQDPPFMLACNIPGRVPMQLNMPQIPQMVAPIMPCPAPAMMPQYPSVQTIPKQAPMAYYPQGSYAQPQMYPQQMPYPQQPMPQMPYPQQPVAPQMPYPQQPVQPVQLQPMMMQQPGMPVQQTYLNQEDAIQAMMNQARGRY